MGGRQLGDVDVFVAGVGDVVRAGTKDDHPLLRNVDQVLGVAAGEIADRAPGAGLPAVGGGGQEGLDERQRRVGLKPVGDLEAVDAVAAGRVPLPAGGDDPLQLGDHGLRVLAGHHAPVDPDGAGVGHDVGADPALDHADVDAGAADQRVDAVVQHLGLVALQREDQVRHAVDGVAPAPGLGGVGRGALDVKGRAQHPLVGDRHAVVGLFAHHHEVRGRQVAVLRQPERPEPAADLFLGGADDRQPAAELLALRAQHCAHQEHGRHRPLVVDAAEPVELAVGTLAAKGIVGPAGVLAQRHRVDVGVIEQGAAIFGPDRGHDAPGAVVGRHQGDRKAGVRQVAGTEFGDGTAVARGIGRRDGDQPLQQVGQRVHGALSLPAGGCRRFSRRRQRSSTTAPRAPTAASAGQRRARPWAP